MPTAAHFVAVGIIGNIQTVGSHVLAGHCAAFMCLLTLLLSKLCAPCRTDLAMLVRQGRSAFDLGVDLSD